jgi:hypothetical protein
LPVHLFCLKQILPASTGQHKLFTAEPDAVGQKSLA